MSTAEALPHVDGSALCFSMGMHMPPARHAGRIGSSPIVLGKREPRTQVVFVVEAARAQGKGLQLGAVLFKLRVSRLN